MLLDETDLHNKFEQVLSHVQKDIASLRTGRASIAILDDVDVEVYGSKMKIQELANISIPDPNMILIRPWDKNSLENIERAIRISHLNLNPVVDQDQIRIVIPQLTEETRQEMVKSLAFKIESGKVMLRTVRNDFKKEIEAFEGEAGVSEDDIKRDLEDLDKEIKIYSEKLDEMAERKKKELINI